MNLMSVRYKEIINSRDKVTIFKNRRKSIYSCSLFLNHDILTRVSDSHFYPRNKYIK